MPRTTRDAAGRGGLDMGDEDSRGKERRGVRKRQLATAGAGLFTGVHAAAVKTDGVFLGFRSMVVVMQTIATFSKVEEAHLLRMRLESVGIEAVLLDENMAQLEQP